MTEITNYEFVANRPKTLVERVDEDPERNLELAAARAEIRAIHLLRRAFEASGMTQKNLAERVGVTEGRVSQVLHSEGNLRVTTIARYLRALGYRFELNAKPAEEGVRPLRQRVSRRKKHHQRTVAVYASRTEGVQKLLLSVRRDDTSPTEGRFEYIGDVCLDRGQGTTNSASILRTSSELRILNWKNIQEVEA